MTLTRASDGQLECSEFFPLELMVQFRSVISSPSHFRIASDYQRNVIECENSKIKEGLSSLFPKAIAKHQIQNGAWNLDNRTRDPVEVFIGIQKTEPLEQ
jgi:hypothetical protein